MDEPIYRLDQYSLPGPQGPPGQARALLEIIRGRVQRRLRSVHSKIFLIGAASDCDLVLGDLQFPEAYAYLFVSGEQVSIRRLGAGPALLVCGQQVESAELFQGDAIAFGPFELRLHVSGPAAEKRPGDRSESATDEVESLLLDIRRGLADDRPRPHYAARAAATY